MGKNDTLADSVNPLEIDGTNGEINITQDESFKHLVRYKGIAAIILQAVIPEFSDMSLIEIARSIVNTRSRPKNQTATNILEDEIDFLPSESGTKDEKNTIQDASFRVRRKGVINTIDLRTLSKMSSMDTMYTTNLEMQNHTSHLGGIAFCLEQFIMQQHC